MDDDDEAALRCVAHENEAVLVFGVVGIMLGDRERIRERGCGLVEGDAVCVEV